jgi:hypothetical protein
MQLTYRSFLSCKTWAEILNYSRLVFNRRLWKWLIKTLLSIYGNGWIGHQPFIETASNCSGEDLAWICPFALLAEPMRFLKSERLLSEPCVGSLFKNLCLETYHGELTIYINSRSKPCIRLWKWLDRGSSHL